MKIWILLIFFIYLHILYPNINWHDTAEFQIASYTLSIAHPTGYPLYLLVGKLITTLPIGNIAYRLNMLSSIFTGLTLILAYFLIKTLLKHTYSAIVSVSILAFSSILLKETIMAEVYSTHLAFIIGIVYLLLKEKKKLALYILSLSLAHHISIIIFIPGILAFIFFKYRTDLKELMLSFLFFILLASLLYFYLPIRSIKEPILDTGNPESLVAIAQLIKGGEFQPALIMGWAKIATQIRMLLIYFKLLTNQLSIIAPVLFIFGMYKLFKINRAYSFLLLYFFLINIFFFINYRVEDVEVFFLPSFTIATIFISGGIKLIIDFFKGLVNKTILPILSQELLLISYIIPIIFVIINFFANVKLQLRYSNEANVYAKQVLSKLKIESFIINSGSFDDWKKAMPIAYMRYIANYNPTVEIIHDHKYIWLKKGLIPIKSTYALNFNEEIITNFDLQKEKNLYKINKKRPSLTNIPLSTEAEIIDITPYTNSDYRHNIFLPNPELGEATFPTLSSGIIFFNKNIPFYILDHYSNSFLPSAITTAMPNFDIEISLKKAFTYCICLAATALIDKENHGSCARLIIYYEDGTTTCKNIYSCDLTQSSNIIFKEENLRHLNCLIINTKINTRVEKLRIIGKTGEKFVPALAILAITQLYF